MQFLNLLGFVILFGCVENKKVEPTVKPDLTTNKTIDSTFLLNQTDSKIDFYYFDKYNDLIQVFLNPKSKASIYTEVKIKIIQSNKYQPFYIVYPSDTITVSIDSKGNAILKSFQLPERNSELDFSRQLNDLQGAQIFKDMMFVRNNSNKNYSKVDSFYRERYSTANMFVKKMNTVVKLSGKFNNYLQSYFLRLYILQKIGLLQEVADRQKSLIAKDIDSLQRIYNSYKANLELPYDITMEYELLRYEYSRINRLMESPDSLYNYTSRTVDEAYRNEILFFIVKKELESNSKSTKNFVTDFITHSNNNAFVRYIKNLRKSYSPELKGALLFDSIKRNIDFDSLISQNKGKVIYIDFWASWCVPCREEMPSSFQLRDQYKSESILFIYISTDDNFNKWIQASTKEGLDSYNYSYVMQDFQNSNLKRKYKMETVPRYIVIDKGGGISNLDAPRPSDASLVPLLKRLLKE